MALKEKCSTIDEQHTAIFLILQVTISMGKAKENTLKFSLNGLQQMSKSILFHLVVINMSRFNFVSSLKRFYGAVFMEHPLKIIFFLTWQKVTLNLHLKF